MTEETGKKKWSIKGSGFFKITAAILFVACVAIAIYCAGCAFYLFDRGFYDGSYRTELRENMRTQAIQDFHEIEKLYSTGKSKVILSQLAYRNLAVTIDEGNPEVMLLDTRDPDGDYRISYRYEGDGFGYRSDPCYYNLYIDERFQYTDSYSALYKHFMDSCNIGYLGMDYDFGYPIIAGASVLIGFFLFLYLMCAAGHKNKRDGIVLGMFGWFHFDVLTGFFATVILGITALWVGIAEELYAFYQVIWAIAIYSGILASFLLYYLMHFAARVKAGRWWQNTLIYKILKWCRRVLKKFFTIIWKFMQSIPMVPLVAGTFGGLSVLELFIAICDHRARILLWVIFLDKLVLFPIVVYIAVMCKKLQQSGQALAEGKLEQKVDTKHMYLSLKEHGETLNHIGDGMSKAVEERMKSERLKTELITNVSHDLKTPLTSIINYADLLGEEGISAETIREYAEVLHRQSLRLKKLLDDLMEASKAATGNLEVHPEKCDIGVILSQSIGEYEQRFAEKELVLVEKTPEEELLIYADGRHLWRIFDNLLNNVCKYAMERTRVYLTLEKKDDAAVVTLKNMSKFALDVSGEELQERFVRGDKSRHMEGSGLGLSIAKSLMDLQKGTMEIVTDGDLFKIILRFPLVKES